MSRTTRSAVWLESNFLKLWTGNVISAFCDSGYFILLNWFVISTTHSDAALGTTLTLAALPRLGFMMIGGVIADRFNRKWILVLSLSARAVVLFSLCIILSLTHTPSHWVLYLIAFLFGTVDAFYWPASSSIVPYVVEKASLGAANGLIQTAQQASMILGPLAAAALLFIHDDALMFAPVAVLYLVSAGMLVMLRVKSREPRESSSSSAPPSRNERETGARREMVAGLRYVLSVRILVLIMVISLFVNLAFMGPINIGLPVFVSHMGWTGGTYGSMESAFSAGSIGGGLLVVVMRGLRGRMRWLPYIGTLMGLGMAALAFVRAPWQGFILLACIGAVVSIVNIPILTYIQTIVPDDKLGRVMSLISTMSVGLQPVSYALSSLLLGRGIVQPWSLFLICGLMLVTMMVLTAVPRDFRQAEDHPLWQVADSRNMRDPLELEANSID